MNAHAIRRACYVARRSPAPRVIGRQPGALFGKPVCARVRARSAERDSLGAERDSLGAERDSLGIKRDARSDERGSRSAGRDADVEWPR